MKTYNVSITRQVTASFGYTVEAHSEDDAKRRALQLARDDDWSAQGAADYSADHVEETGALFPNERDN